MKRSCLHLSLGEVGMSEHKLDVALDDIFEWSGILPSAKKEILDEIEGWIGEECASAEIPIGQVDMERTLDNVRIVAELYPKEE